MNRLFKNIVLNHTTPSKILGDRMGIENGRKTSLYAVAGVLIAIVIIAGVFFSGVQFPGSVKAGTLTVLVTDAPVDLKYLNLTIDSLSIQDSEGKWINLDLTNEDKDPDPNRFYFDLLSLQDEFMKLSDTSIQQGTYTMLKMHVLTANATCSDDTVITNLRVPSEYIKVLLKPHLEMNGGDKVSVLIDLEPDVSNIAISHSLNLKPTVKAILKS